MILKFGVQLMKYGIWTPAASDTNLKCLSIFSSFDCGMGNLISIGSNISASLKSVIAGGSRVYQLVLMIKYVSDNTTSHVDKIRNIVVIWTGFCDCWVFGKSQHLADVDENQN